MSKEKISLSEQEYLRSHKLAFLGYFTSLAESFDREAIKRRASMMSPLLLDTTDAKPILVQPVLVTDWKTGKHGFCADMLHTAAILPDTQQIVGATCRNITFDEDNTVHGWLATLFPGMGVGRVLHQAETILLPLLAKHYSQLNGTHYLTSKVKDHNYERTVSGNPSNHLLAEERQRWLALFGSNQETHYASSANESIEIFSGNTYTLEGKVAEENLQITYDKLTQMQQKLILGTE